MKFLYIFLLCLFSTFALSQTPTGSVVTYEDTMYVSVDGRFVNILAAAEAISDTGLTAIDTTELKLLSGLKLGQAASLHGYSAGSSVGKGMFIYTNSATPDGTDNFDAPGPFYWTRATSSGLVAADTTELKSFSLNDGQVVYLKGLSTSNSLGGGDFVQLPESDYAIDGVNSFDSGVAGKVMVRMAYLYGFYIKPEWAGAIPDDSGDDYSDVIQAYALCKTSGKILQFDKGTYRMSAKWNIVGFGGNLSTSQALPIIKGFGRNRTILYFYNGTDGIHFNGGQGQSPSGWIGQFGIEGIDVLGTDAVGTSGMIFDSTGTCYARFGAATNFYNGFKITQSNGLRVSDNRVHHNVHGIHASISPNELTLENNYVTDNDSFQIYINSGNAQYITGGAVAHGWNGIVIENGASVTVNSIIMEGIEGYGLHISNNGQMYATRVSFAVDTAPTGHMSHMAFVGNGKLSINMSTHTIHSDSTAYQLSGTGADLYRDNISHGKVRWTPTSTEYEVAANSSVDYLSSSSFVEGWADDDTWGQWIAPHWRGNTISDLPSYVIRTKDSDSSYFAFPLGGDIRVASTGTAQPLVDRTPMRTVTGKATWQRAAGTDSTVVDVVVDSSGYLTIFGISAIPNFLNNSRIGTDYSAYVTVVDDDPSAGTIKFKIVHNEGSGPLTGQNYTLHWTALIRPKFWRK